MADGQHKLSRRALLGAVCASPLVRHAPSRHSGLYPESTLSSPAPEGRRWIHDRDPSGTVRGTVPPEHQVRDDEVALWARGLARLQQTQAVLDSARSEPDQDRYDALLDAHAAALTALLALPAPDPAALAAKLDHIVGHQAWENSGSEDCLEILRHDAMRLLACPPDKPR